MPITMLHTHFPNVLFRASVALPLPTYDIKGFFGELVRVPREALMSHAGNCGIFGWPRSQFFVDQRIDGVGYAGIWKGAQQHTLGLLSMPIRTGLCRSRWISNSLF